MSAVSLPGESVAVKASAPSINSTKALNDLGFYNKEPPIAFLTLDPSGDGEDNNALVLMFREEFERGERYDIGYEHQMIYRFAMMHRLRSDMEFPEVLAALLRAWRVLVGMRDRGRIGDYAIIVETNGVGHGYYHSVRSKVGDRVLGVYTSGGDKDSAVNQSKIIMPRMAGLDNFRLLLEQQQVKLAIHPETGVQAPGATAFKSELGSFVWRGPKKPEALAGQKDDLVMAAAIGAWVASKLYPPVAKAVRIPKPKPKKFRGYG